MRPLAITKKTIDATMVQTIIDEACQLLVETVDPLQIYLVGSASEGRMTDQSDIDLLVVYDEAKELKQLQKNYYQKRPSFSVAVEIIWTPFLQFERKKDLGGICFTAATQGKLLYAREKK